jgi:hypothetical protein
MKWAKFKFWQKAKKKKQKAQKEGQKDFFADYDEAEKETSKKPPSQEEVKDLGLAEDTKWAKAKKKEADQEAKRKEKEKAEEKKEQAIKEGKEKFRAGADVKVIEPKEEGMFPRIIAVKVRQPKDTKYIKVDLQTNDVSITKDLPKGLIKGDLIRITSVSKQKPKVKDIKLLGAKIRITDSGQVIYDKKSIKKGKGYFRSKFAPAVSKGSKSYMARLRKKTGKGLNLEW